MPQTGFFLLSDLSYQWNAGWNGPIIKTINRQVHPAKILRYLQNKPALSTISLEMSFLIYIFNLSQKLFLSTHKKFYMFKQEKASRAYSVLVRALARVKSQRIPKMSWDQNSHLIPNSMQSKSMHHQTRIIFLIVHISIRLFK